MILARLFRVAFALAIAAVVLVLFAYAFLAALIVHLNDDHKWSREQIAVWLEGDGKPQPRPA